MAHCLSSAIVCHVTGSRSIMRLYGYRRKIRSSHKLSNSYTMAWLHIPGDNTLICPPVRGDTCTPRALASELSPVQLDNHSTHTVKPV